MRNESDVRLPSHEYIFSPGGMDALSEIFKIAMRPRVLYGDGLRDMMARPGEEPEDTASQTRISSLLRIRMQGAEHVCSKYPATGDGKAQTCLEQDH